MILSAKLADLAKAARANPPPSPEQNPVEWIMITRSDPGGSVPRWMVERGTPGGIIKDAEKFIGWATGNPDLQDEYPEQAEAEHEGAGVRDPDSSSTGQQIQEDSKGEMIAEPGTEPRASSAPEILGPTSSALTHGETSTPGPIASTASRNTSTSPPPNRPSTIPEDTASDTASCASFATARSGDLSTSTTHPRTDEEKALSRLLREKAKLAEKLQRQRSRDRKKRSKDDEREHKLLEKHMREVEKREARYAREVEKARKREEKRKGKENREVMELKAMVEALTKQNLDLMERVGELEGRGRRRGEREVEVEVEVEVEEKVEKEHSSG